MCGECPAFVWRMGWKVHGGIVGRLHSHLGHYHQLCGRCPAIVWRMDFRVR